MRKQNKDAERHPCLKGVETCDGAAVGIRPKTRKNNACKDASNQNFNPTLTKKLVPAMG